MAVRLPDAFERYAKRKWDGVAASVEWDYWLIQAERLRADCFVNHVIDELGGRNSWLVAVGLMMAFRIQSLELTPDNMHRCVAEIFLPGVEYEWYQYAGWPYPHVILAETCTASGPTITKDSQVRRRK